MMRNIDGVNEECEQRKSAACALAALLIFGLTSADARAADPEALWLDRLDAWVAEGGPVDKVQSDVVENCGRLLMYDAGATEAARMAATTEGRKDLDLQVDVCAKITVNRAMPQPEFQNPAIRKIVCGDLAIAHPAIAKLCQRAKVSP